MRSHTYGRTLSAEYEVARLYCDGSFRRQIDGQFEGNFKLRIHLAPQFFNRRDPETGRARKFALGPWMFAVLGVMARFKFLRGTPLDPFGWTAHRRRERQLIREYEGTLDEILAGLSSDNHALAVELASLPEFIRGFDCVKERSIAETKAKEAELLDAFRRPATSSSLRQLS